MTPIFPNQRMRMERDSGNVAMRIVDLICTGRQGTARNDRVTAESRKDDTVKRGGKVHPVEMIRICT